MPAPCTDTDTDAVELDTSALRVDVADLLAQPAGRRPLHRRASLSDVAATAARPVGSAELHLVLEHVPEGVVVHGTVRTRWEAPCSRCLESVGGELEVQVGELFERDPVDGDTYLLDGDEVDLAGPVRDTVALELPVVPRCSADCRGLCPVCGENRNHETCNCEEHPRDPRWAPLEQLEL